MSARPWLPDIGIEPSSFFFCSREAILPSAAHEAPHQAARRHGAVNESCVAEHVGVSPLVEWSAVQPSLEEVHVFPLRCPEQLTNLTTGCEPA